MVFTLDQAHLLVLNLQPLTLGILSLCCHHLEFFAFYLLSLGVTFLFD
jgi:hypothetical protein